MDAPEATARVRCRDVGGSARIHPKETNARWNSVYAETWKVDSQD